MKKQREVTETYCDGCGKWYEPSPQVIVGRYDSGWKNMHDMDLCPVCVGIISHNLMENASKAIITDMVNDIKENKSKNGLNFILSDSFTISKN